MRRLSGVFAIGSLLGLALASCEQPTESRPAPIQAEAAASSPLTFFTDRQTFSAGLTRADTEDFEKGTVLDGEVVACRDTVSSASNDHCFTPNDIKPGVEFKSDPPHDGEGGIDLVGPGLPLEAPSKNIVAGFTADAFIIEFPPDANVTAAGMDVIAYFEGQDCQIDVFGANDVPLGSTAAPCTNQGVFWGVSSTQAITRIRIFSPSLGFEGVDNIAFGAGVPQRQPPVADAGGLYTGSEGSVVAFDGSRSSDPGGAALTFQWNFGDGTPAEPGAKPSHTYADNGSYTVTLTVSNGSLTSTATTMATIANVAPTVGPITAPVDPVVLGTSVTASASFTDPGSLDTHTAMIDWGDGTPAEPGAVSEADGSGSASGSHSYAEAGVYIVTLKVTDKDDEAEQSVFEFVVVFNPEAGFVTGGGWIDSPAGAYALDPTLVGKATFGFVARSQKGATPPSGSTEFAFHVAGLQFHSTSYDWVVVAGSKVQFKGSGTINGVVGDFRFLLTAVDGDVSSSRDADTFRIKIWDEATGIVIYDNQMGSGSGTPATTLLGGGSIVIHS